MTDDLRTRVIAVLSGHRPRWGEWVTCSCDDDFSRFAPEIYEQHVADAVIQELDDMGIIHLSKVRTPSFDNTRLEP